MSAELKFTERGIPILSLPDKLAALEMCLADEAWEDAACHLCDLLEVCRQRIEVDGMVWSNLRTLVFKYGQNPAPVVMT